MTKLSEIKVWFERGVKNGYTHMAVFCDTFSYDNYPSYFTEDSPEAAKRAVSNRLRESDMQRLMEVYHLGSPWEAQTKGRVMNYEPLTDLEIIASGAN